MTSQSTVTKWSRDQQGKIYKSVREAQLLPW